MFAGIDGGQSSSVCVLGDDAGTVLARVSGPPADLVGEPPNSTRRRDTIDALLASAAERAGLPNRFEFRAVVAGVSGADPEIAPAPAPRTRNVRIVHDTEIAHAGAFDGAPGVLVIAGTGSVALAIDEHGNRARAGGWGYYFGDEGSALWIARTALRFAMEEHDCGRSSAIEQAAHVRLGADSLREIQHAYANGTLDRVRLAAFAPAVCMLAQNDEPASKLIVDAAARALGEIAAIAGDRLGCTTVSYAGGLFTSEFVRTFGEQLAALRPACRLIAPRHPPEIGALLLARRAANPVAAP